MGRFGGSTLAYSRACTCTGPAAFRPQALSSHREGLGYSFLKFAAQGMMLMSGLALHVVQQGGPSILF